MCTTSEKSAAALFVETRAKNQDNVGMCRTKLIIIIMLFIKEKVINIHREMIPINSMK